MGFQRVCAPFGRVLRDRVPESLVATSEIPFAVQNGARGEKTDRFSRGGDDERLPLFSLRINISPKRSSGTFWTYFTFIATEWQWLAPLLGNFSLAEISSFEACRLKIHLLDTLFRQRLRAQVGVFRPLRRTTMGLCPLDPYQRGHRPLWKPIVASLTLQQLLH